MLNQTRRRKDKSNWLILVMFAAFAIFGLLLSGHLINGQTRRDILAHMVNTQWNQPKSKLCKYVGVKAGCYVEDGEEIYKVVEQLDEGRNIWSAKNIKRGWFRKADKIVKFIDNEGTVHNIHPSECLTHAQASIGTEGQSQGMGMRHEINGVIYELTHPINVRANVWKANAVGGTAVDESIVKIANGISFVYDLVEYNENTCFIEEVKKGCTVTVMDETVDKKRTFVVDGDKRLGRGACGDVWMAHVKGNEIEKVAVKFVKHRPGFEDVVIFEDETEVTKQINKLIPDGTVKCYGSAETKYPETEKGKWILDVIVMQLFACDALEYFECVAEGRTPSVSISDARKMAMKMTESVTKVAKTMWEEEGLVAHDIKLPNIFVDVDEKLKMTSSALGDHGFVTKREKLNNAESLDVYYRTGTWISPLDVLQRGRAEYRLDMSEEDKREKLIQSDVVFDINVAVTDTLQLLSPGSSPFLINELFKYIIEIKMNLKPRKFASLYNFIDQFKSRMDQMVEHIPDKDTFKAGTRRISMEEVMIWTHWASFKQIEEEGKEEFMITLDEYAKMIGRIDCGFVNQELNARLYAVADTCMS